MTRDGVRVRAPRRARPPCSPPRTRPRCAPPRPTPCSRRGGSRGWELAVALERSLASRTPRAGRVASRSATRASAASCATTRTNRRRCSGSRDRAAAASTASCPAAMRTRILHSLGAELAPLAVLAGPPSVAHAEALLRTIAARGTTLERPLDAICLGIPRTTPYLPRERPNPLLAATRRARPRAPPLARRLPGRRRRHGGPRAPVRAALRAPDAGALPRLLRGDPRRAHRGGARRRRGARGGGRARGGGVPRRPRLPSAARRSRTGTPAGRRSRRLDTVLVAGCRDGAAARALGFVPVASIRGALDMARAQAGDGVADRLPRRAAVVPDQRRPDGLGAECDERRAPPRALRRAARAPEAWRRPMTRAHTPPPDRFIRARGEAPSTGARRGTGGWWAPGSPTLIRCRGTPCGPARSPSAPRRRRPARCGPSPARSRGWPRRAPSARSAPRAGSACPAG